MRGVTFESQNIKNICYISTHTPHARRDKWNAKKIQATIISTHTPHARRDMIVDDLIKNAEDFNSHASCEA